jgi:adenylate cyclase
MTANRRLAAILAADVVGYSRLIGADEEGTLERLKSVRAGIIDPTIAAHRGRLVKTTGDGLLVEFFSAVDALRCAIEWQRRVAERNAAIAGDRIEFRMGLNVGDVVVENDDIFGDGVNVAARLEGLAEPGGICVSARVQEDAAGRLDLTFEDLGDQSLKNIARPVRVYRVGLATTESKPTAWLSESTPVLALPDKPSIAVLPFQNMSGDPEQEYFADGMVEEIVTALSRIRWLFVIARNSTFCYKGHSPDLKQVGRELGVRYVLEGSVRKGGNRVRITTQLIAAETAGHLWADRFDGSLEDVFDLQDKIAISVAGVIEPALQVAEIRRSNERPTNDLTAYDLYLRALGLVFPVTKEGLATGLEIFGRAIKRDPYYGPALSWAAICHMLRILNGWAEVPEESRSKAGDLARQALRMTQNDPGVLVNAAHVLAQLGEDIGAMIGLVERALAMNPSFARGWYISGFLRIFAGQHDVAIEHVETALRLSPRGGLGNHLSAIGMAYFFKHRFDEAAATLRLSIQDHPGHAAAFRVLAACYAHMGRLDDAQGIITRLRAISPEAVPTLMNWRKPEDRELFLSGLRLAMGEPK